MINTYDIDDKDFEKIKFYITIISLAVEKDKSEIWVPRIMDKVFRICKWSEEDPIRYAKTLFHGQDAIALERFLDWELAKVEKDRNWGVR